MNPSHNVWAAPSTPDPTSTQYQQYNTTHIHNTPPPAPHGPPTHQASSTSHYEDVIAKLTNELETLKASKKKTTTTAKQTNAKSKKPINPPTGTTRKLAAARPLKNAPQSTPKNISRAVSAPPEMSNIKKIPQTPKLTKVKAQLVKAPSPKRHPQQMQTGDFPPTFNSTKAALFVHIKILWGLMTQDLVPKAPNISALTSFYQRFTDAAQIETAVAASGNALIESQKVECFNNVRAGRLKMGKSVIHLGDNFVRYARGLLSRLGLQVWCPNLEEDSTSLYNAAHRIAALTTFQELAATSAYVYLNIDPKMVTDMPLLIRAYNHFVHYLMFSKYNRELKEAGQNSKESENKRISKNRERLRNERRDFAILNKFPKRYQRVLSQIGAHSDDELVEGKGFYVIKTLPFRSTNANRFFRRLDAVMIKAAQQDPVAKQSRRRVRRLPKTTPVMSSCKIAPKGLPIDFYHPKWFHDLIPAHQHTIPDRKALAFLPDAKKSLLPKAERHPDEKLADSTFTRKYWEILAEPYGLVDGDSSEDESEVEHREEEEGDDEGEGIDLTQPSPDASDEEYLAEGDAGDLYDDDDFVEDDSNEGEDDSYEGEDHSSGGERNSSEGEDDDHQFVEDMEMEDSEWV